jgi:hypothetical protein
MFGAFGNARSAYALEGDICTSEVVGPGGLMESSIENGVEENFVFTVEKNVTYGVVFRVEDSANNSENVTVRIDSETGSAKITSKAEDLSGNPANGDIGHILVTPPASTQVVDTMDPDQFDDADGNPMDSISGWLDDVGYNGSGVSDADSVCGASNDGPSDNVAADDDLWGFVDFKCIEFGTFFVDILTPDDTEETGMSLKFVCPGVPDTAKIAASPSTVETFPATAGIAANASMSKITVTVYDQDGNNLDGAHVTLTTDDCTFVSDGGDVSADLGGVAISPAGGGKTVDIVSDTDSATDDNFVTDNPLQTQAGTAEAVLDCSGSKGTPGTAHITAVVNRPGSDVVLTVDVKVVGPTASNGLVLSLSSTNVSCGQPITATAKAVDAQGLPVSDGTLIRFTTDTSSGVVGGSEGAQGGVPSVGGSASVIIATDPGNPGPHTVVAYVINAAGGVAVQTSATYQCSGPPAPATVTSPGTGTGSGSISPPNTGDAGLARSSTNASLFVLAGVVAFVLAGVASLKFARR